MLTETDRNRERESDRQNSDRQTDRETERGIQVESGRDQASWPFMGALPPAFLENSRLL